MRECIKLFPKIKVVLLRNTCFIIIRSNFHILNILYSYALHVFVKFNGVLCMRNFYRHCGRLARFNGPGDLTQLQLAAAHNFRPEKSIKLFNIFLIKAAVYVKSIR